MEAQHHVASGLFKFLLCVICSESTREKAHRLSLGVNVESCLFVARYYPRLIKRCCLLNASLWLLVLILSTTSSFALN